MAQNELFWAYTIVGMQRFSGKERQISQKMSEK